MKSLVHKLLRWVTGIFSASGKYWTPRSRVKQNNRERRSHQPNEDTLTASGRDRSRAGESRLAPGPVIPVEITQPGPTQSHHTGRSQPSPATNKPMTNGDSEDKEPKHDRQPEIGSTEPMAGIEQNTNNQDSPITNKPNSENVKPHLLVGESSAKPDSEKTPTKPESSTEVIAINTEPHHSNVGHASSDKPASDNGNLTGGFEKEREHESEHEPEAEGMNTTGHPSPNVIEIPIPRRRQRRVATTTRPAVTRSIKPKPALLCRRDDATAIWEIIVTMPDGFSNLRCNGDSISADSGADCALPAFSGEITMEGTDREIKRLQLFYERHPLIFKMNKNWSGIGKQLRKVTKGCFVVIAPSDWVQVGHVPRESEWCSDERFMAYFIYVNADTSQGRFGFEECSLDITSLDLLSGSKVFDATEDCEIYCGKPPVLNKSENFSLGRVKSDPDDAWVSETFCTHDTSLGEILGKRWGRFDLDVRNSEHELIDQSTFRYCASLKEIRVGGNLYSQDTLIFPTSSGHSTTEVQFVGTDGSILAPISVEGRRGVSVTRTGSVNISPCQANDDTIWLLSESEHGAVQIKIRLCRLRWRIKSASTKSKDDWSDVPIQMTREKFSELRDAILELSHLPEKARVRCGFNTDSLQYFTGKEGIPFGSFAEYSEIEEPSSTGSVLGIRIDGYEPWLPIVLIRPDYGPMSQLLTPRRPVVKCRVGARQGKGFSISELKASGLRREAWHSVPVDKRRRNTHQANIEELRRKDQCRRNT